MTWAATRAAAALRLEQERPDITAIWDRAAFHAEQGQLYERPWNPPMMAMHSRMIRHALADLRRAGQTVGARPRFKDCKMGAYGLSVANDRRVESYIR